MVKKISIIVIIILVLSLAGWFFYQKRIEDENLMFKQKYAVLNQLKVEELKNMPSDTYDSICKLFDEYISDIREEKNRVRIESLLPNMKRIDRELRKEIMRRDNEKKRQFAIKRFRENYSRFLREVKGIKDEAIIKQEAEKYSYTRELGEEEKKEFDKFCDEVIYKD